MRDTGFGALEGAREKYGAVVFKDTLYPWVLVEEEEFY